MRDQEFRDAVTRAQGAIDGQETNAIQWDRFNP